MRLLRWSSWGEGLIQVLRFGVPVLVENYVVVVLRNVAL